MYKGYLIDLDGTAYHGTKVVEETLQFVQALHEKNIPYLFLTNKIFQNIVLIFLINGYRFK